VCVMLCKILCCSWGCVQEQWCSCGGAILVEWKQLAPGRAHQLHQQLTGLLWCWQHHSPAMVTELLVSSCSACQPIWSDPCHSCCDAMFAEVLGAHSVCTKLKRTDTKLDTKTQWCKWQYNCQSLRVKLY
jgi:hypothetical protein